jgi:hypothetical protein
MNAVLHRRLPRRRGCSFDPTRRACNRIRRIWINLYPDLTEREVREALERLEPLWEELFPAEQTRIVPALVERVVVEPAGADIRLQVEGLAGLVRGLAPVAPEARRAAA